MFNIIIRLLAWLIFVLGVFAVTVPLTIGLISLVLYLVDKFSNNE